jgi:hypothetical protein
MGDQHFVRLAGTASPETASLHWFCKILAGRSGGQVEFISHPSRCEGQQLAVVLLHQGLLGVLFDAEHLTRNRGSHNRMTIGRTLQSCSA